MNLRYEGNRLYLDDQEVREWSCARSDEPAHYQDIVCVGFSANGIRIISADKSGDLKIWDPKGSSMRQRVWRGDGFSNATAVAVTDQGRRFAVAQGLIIVVYDLVDGRYGDFSKSRLEEVCLDLKDKVAFLQFTDDDHLICRDVENNEVVFRRRPLWEVE